MNDSNLQLSIVVPMYNEQESVPELFRRLISVTREIGVSYEILCVDDGSTDKTWARIREIQSTYREVRGIRLSRNFGKEIALAAGLDNARGAAIVFMDADLQDPPELIAEFVELWRRGYQNVYGVRVDRSRDTFFKRSTANAFYRIFNLMTERPLPPHAGDFRLLGPDMIEALRGCREKSRLMKGLYSWVGFPSIGVPYQRPTRFIGRTKIGPWRLWRIGLDGLVSHSTSLLRIWTYVGAFVILLAMGLGVWLLCEYFLFHRNPPGFYLIIMVLLGFSAFNFIMLGIIGEYLGRIFEEVKGRPLYLERHDDLEL